MRRTRSWFGRRRALLPALAPVLLALIGCAQPVTDPERIPVAYVGDEALTLSQLQDYFDSNLLRTDPGELAEPAPGEMAEVWSRLFDAFVEERLLLAEAERRELPVDEREIELYLQHAPAEEGDGAEPVDLSRLVGEARRRLMIQKLQEDALRELPSPGEDEVRSYVVEHRHRLVPERSLELRSLMLDSVESARKVQQDIRKRRLTFAEAVVRYEKSPGQGLPMQVNWNGLSEEVRAALEDLRAGQVSDPVEVNGNVYIFQVVSWFEKREQANEELIRRARLELERERRRDAYDAMVDDIRDRTEIRLKLRNLPFSYVRDSTG